jgi:hypothetical protein
MGGGEDCLSGEAQKTKSALLRKRMEHPWSGERQKNRERWGTRQIDRKSEKGVFRRG